MLIFFERGSLRVSKFVVDEVFQHPYLNCCWCRSIHDFFLATTRKNDTGKVTERLYLSNWRKIPRPNTFDWN